VLASDMAMTGGSIMFVWVWIYVHTSSSMMASTGMLQIVLSLPLSFFVYRYLFGITFFSELHNLVIFLVLGIGADDVFVLFDAWKQSEWDVDVSGLSDPIQIQKKRMTYALERTVYAVFNTSFTTAFAFASVALSDLMPISTFGIYAALCIIANYILAVTFTPCTILVYHRFFEHKGCCGCKPLDRGKPF